MSVDIRIAGGTIVRGSGLTEADVLIADGKIVGSIGRDVEVSDTRRVVDAKGKYVLPGMVDTHVHTREPGYTHKEDILTTSWQAAAGGVTTICGMPNVDPPTTTKERLAEAFDLYQAKSIVDWNHHPAGVLPEQAASMAGMGIRGFKIYMVVDTGRTYPHPAGVGLHDHGGILRAMDAIAPTGKKLIVHPHDQSIMDYIEGEILADGRNTPEGYANAYAARDGVIWDTAVDTILRLAEASDCRIHLAHMQTQRSIEAVARAKDKGLQVSCEVNHWALFLSTWNDIERLGPYALSYWVPDDAREALWAGVRDGTIDMAASDHAPHTREEKEIGWTNMWASHTGTPGLQFYYPLLLNAAREGILPLPRIVNLVAENPAREFGMVTKGGIALGKDADLVIADFDTPFTISNEGVLSKCGWTPYDGLTCGVTIERTIVRGRDVFADGRVVGEPGSGKMA